MTVVTGATLKRELEVCQEKIEHKATELKGMVACKSKYTIRGLVKIVRNAIEITKIKKGDILVTSETTPDYVIGMRTASAIVTDHGGLTSHAAIISRELGIPCIIGTNIATRVLHDGDMVEVNTANGTIRKCEQNAINSASLTHLAHIFKKLSKNATFYLALTA